MVADVLSNVEALNVDAFEELAHRIDRVRPPLLKPVCLLLGEFVGGSNARARGRAVDFGGRVAIGSLRRGTLQNIQAIGRHNSSFPRNKCRCCNASVGSLQEHKEARHLQVAKLVNAEADNTKEYFILTNGYEERRGEKAEKT